VLETWDDDGDAVRSLSILVQSLPSKQHCRRARFSRVMKLLVIFSPARGRKLYTGSNRLA
jgi:hypothetical protein